ncbi:MAG: response regulator [Candidatus Omnitrophica bacterium]|nr:response regulator [Candidatus Omnitrophota bacterium]
MPYTILLVDDDREFREEFRDSFDEYRVIEADSGERALEVLTRPNEIDLVVLDEMMPGLKGTEVLKKIKKNSPELGIVLLTGYSTKDLAIEALKGRADEYVEKPIDIEKTRAIVARLLESRQPEVSAIDIEGKVERIKQFAARNYHKKISLQDAARVVYLSPKYLSRVFTQVTGQGFNDFKLQVKIRKAKEMLETTGYTVEQISDRLGYQNIESFIRIFKKLTGQTPTAYRKQHKKNGSPPVRKRKPRRMK